MEVNHIRADSSRPEQDNIHPKNQRHSHLLLVQVSNLPAYGGIAYLI
jgi:hypothetical protein